MKVAASKDLRQELLLLPPTKVIDLCLQLVRFKKENKELLSFLLFDVDNESGYVESIKMEINDGFWNMQRTNLQAIKKGLRRILKLISRYSKYTRQKEFEVELRLHFCKNLQTSQIRYRSNKTLSNLYDGQIKKIASIINLVHEDLRYDYQKQLEELLT